MGLMDTIQRLNWPGPFGPQGPSIGIPPDPRRPRIDNGDGTFSTERTITIERDGKYYNVPTIVGGRQYPSETIMKAFSLGQVPHVGEFKSLDKALKAAQLRSKSIKE
jgi:hypothetical protein